MTDTGDWQLQGERALRKVLSSLPVTLSRRQPAQAEIRLVGSKKMRDLNRAYRGKDYATDVLSFEAPQVFRKQGIMGELVICLPVLKRQAREQDLKPEEELRILIVHGVLHLLGYDHERGESAARLMKRWEIRLLALAWPKMKKSGLIKRAMSGNSKGT